MIARAEEFKVKVDKSRLFELYEDSLLGLKELTEHQQAEREHSGSVECRLLISNTLALLT